MVDATAFLSHADRGAVRVLTMRNAGRANAVPLSGWGELADALRDFERSNQRVLVITGADGDFCAGADLAKDGTLPDLADVADNQRMTQRAGDVALAIHRAPKPVIAAVEGLAVGAGMNLAIGCDLVVASATARFAEIFVRRGLTMDVGGTWLLPRLVGLARARDLALTGRVIDAAEALQMGLISRVVPSEGLMTAVLALADELGAGAPLAQRVVKSALDRSSEMTFEEALAFEAQAQAILLASEDAAEGIASFVEQRPPRFQGK